MSTAQTASVASEECQITEACAHRIVNMAFQSSLDRLSVRHLELLNNGCEREANSLAQEITRLLTRT